MGGDDTDGHAFFDHRTGAHIHAIAGTAYTQGSVAGHRRADLDFLKSHLFDFVGDGSGDHLVLFDDGLGGDEVDDVLSADTTCDRLDQSDFDFLTSVNHTLGDSLVGPAIVQGDHNVLGDVGELTGQVSGVGGL